VWVADSGVASALDALKPEQRIFHCPSKGLFSGAAMTSLFANNHVVQKKILPTFTLSLQLALFVEEYFRREVAKEHNHWLIVNDTAIHTDNLAQLIRQVDFMKTLSCSLCTCLFRNVRGCSDLIFYVAIIPDPKLPSLVNGRSFCLTVPLLITKFFPQRIMAGSDISVHIAEVDFKEGTVFPKPSQFAQTSRTLSASELDVFVSNFTKHHAGKTWAALVSEIHQTLKGVLESLVPLALQKAPEEEVIKSGNFFYAMSAEVLLDHECRPFVRTFHDISHDISPQETDQVIQVLLGATSTPLFTSI